MKADDRRYRRRRGSRASRKPREVAPAALSEPSELPPAGPLMATLEPLTEAAEPFREPGDRLEATVDAVTVAAEPPVELPAPPETAFAARIPPPPRHRRTQRWA